MDIELPRFPQPPRRSSLAIFANSLWAFTLREIQNRFGASRLGYFWGLLDAASTTAIFVIMHALIRGHRSMIYGVNPIFFFMYGCVAFFMYTHVVGAQNGALSGSTGLFNYRQIRPIDVLVAKSLFEWGMLLLVFLLFLAGCWLAGVELPMKNAALLAGCLFMMLVFGFGVGLCFEVYATVMPDLRRVFALSSRPLFFISGAFFTIDMVSPKYRAWLLWNPLLHLTDLARGAALPAYTSLGSWSYVMLWTMAVWFIGLASYRRHLHRLT